MAEQVAKRDAKSLREEFQKNDDIRDAGLTTPDSVVRYDDIHYGCREEQVLDVYRPAELKGILPVIVSVHGGGWCYGDKERYQYYCMSLVKHGYAVVNYTYRLAPENKFPSSIEDMVMVFDWVQANAEEYQFDLKNVFAVGDSAGGTQLGIYGNLTTNRSYADLMGFHPMLKLRACALNCGHYDMSNAVQGVGIIAEFMPEQGSSEEIELVDVVRHLTASFPPSFIMTANQDFLYEEAGKLSKLMDLLGIDHEYHCYGSPQKPLGHVFHCDMRLEEAAVCNKEECDFFRKYMI